MYLRRILFLFFALAASASAVIVTGSTGSHDPSRMIYCNGKYFIYSTGGGMKVSTDRVNWTTGTSPFQGFSNSRPPKMVAVIAADQGIWAPDVIFFNNKYYLYYSCAGTGADAGHCAIGLITSPTLDTAAAGYKWTDVGVVIYTVDKTEKKSGIDPAPFIDASGNLWLSWGSGYANGATWSDPTILLSRMDNTTGLRSTADPTYYPTALGHIEGSYMHYRNGYYYQFWNSGGCCDGATSTYTIHLARSANVTGPFVDKSGSTTGSVTLLASTVTMNAVNGAEHGPGHVGILSENGVDRITYHYYPDTGGSVIGEESLVWGSDGWPTVVKDIVPGNFRIVSASNSLALSVRDSSAVDGGPLETRTYATNAYQQWTVALTYSSGTTADGFYRLTSVGSAKAIDLYQSGTTDGTLINQWTTGTGNNQRWLLEQTTDGKYRIESRVSHDVIALPTAAQTPVVKVARTNNGLDAQLTFPSQNGWNYKVWTAPDLKTWTLLNTVPGTGNALTYTHSGGGADARRYWRVDVQQAVNAWTWNNLTNQKWTFSAP